MCEELEKSAKIDGGSKKMSSLMSKAKVEIAQIPALTGNQNSAN